MIYLIHCNKIWPWTDLENSGQEQSDCSLGGNKLVMGDCPTCKSTRAYVGRMIVGFEANDYYFCLACAGDLDEICEPVFANKRHWERIICDICGESLQQGIARKYAP